jgi:hypothetical protein
MFMVARSRVCKAPEGFRLLDGWHALEDDAWRWTKRRFSVQALVTVPYPTLRLTFHLLASHRSMTLTVRARGQDLPPALFTGEGEHTYTAKLPAAPGPIAEPMEIVFEFDHALAAGADERELGVLIDFRGAPPLTLG